ncbi:AIR synthase family protein [candidate division KSB1 bacterium]|nr:AIR synthase family protein [candidate division KSB1 bacterium]
MASELPQIGKVSADIFNEIILPYLGRKRKSVLIGPRNGVDVGVVDIGNDQVMITTTDPIFVVPPYGWERSAWFAVHILASDAVTAGIMPQYITFDLNLPLSITKDEFEILWQVMHRECDQIGMSIISGHTGRYEGSNYPMIGGATVIAIGSKNDYITPTMARPGDVVIITKGAAIEASGLFAATYPDRVAAAYGEQAAKESEELFWQMSVVKDAQVSIQAGVRDNGVTAMHDATECGIWGGLYEIAQASGVGLAIDKQKIIVQDVVSKICELFKIDPYSSISEGTLIMTSRPHKAQEILQRLHDENIPASVVGEIVDQSNGMYYFDDHKKIKLVHPQVDPFWGAFGKAAEGK